MVINDKRVIKISKCSTDKYLIIDFLEIDYIDYLKSIPDNLWKENKHHIQLALLNVNNYKIIDLIYEKINFDVNFIIKNLGKINLELFKYVIGKNDMNEKIKKKIQNNFYYLFDIAFTSYDLEFNKYIIENYFQSIKKYLFVHSNSTNLIQPIQQIQPIQPILPNLIMSLFYNNICTHKYTTNTIETNTINTIQTNTIQTNTIQTNAIQTKTIQTKTIQTNATQTNATEIDFNKIISILERKIKFGILSKHYEVLIYYIDKFNLLNQITKYSISEKIELYKRIFGIYKINSYDKLIELQNLLEINNNIYASQILYSKSHGHGYFRQHCFTSSIINQICSSGDIEYFLKIQKNFNIDKTYYDNKHMLIGMFINGALTKNTNFIKLMYLHLRNDMGIIFDEELMSRILTGILRRLGSNHCEYEDIIYNIINLGGIVKLKGYKIYRDYTQLIKFI